MKPAQMPWNPASTAERQVRPGIRQPIDPQACRAFTNNVLFQSWQTRSDVLNYCAGVALDPNDPDLALKEVESAKERDRVIDKRLDPYSGRYYPREARTELLANIIRNERSVEGIIRSRSWSIVSERCGDKRIGSGNDLYSGMLGRQSSFCSISVGVIERRVSTPKIGILKRTNIALCMIQNIF